MVSQGKNKIFSTYSDLPELLDSLLKQPSPISEESEEEDYKDDPDHKQFYKDLLEAFEMDEESQSLSKYEESYSASEGFDIIPFKGIQPFPIFTKDGCSLLRAVDLQGTRPFDSKCENSVKYVVHQHNLKDGNLEFVKVLYAFGYSYLKCYVTFEARDIIEKIKVYQTCVLQSRNEILIFRPKQV